MVKVNFPALTGIRAIAAYMVFIHHSNSFEEQIFGKQIHNFFGEFHVGVTIFFVLSGFLICNRYYNDVNFNFKSYFLKRFARIYPMYFILTTLTFIFYAITETQNNIKFFVIYILNITFLRGFFDSIKFSGVSQGWSLTVEEIFYILAPFIFFMIKKNKYAIIILPIIGLLTGLLLVKICNHVVFYGLIKDTSFMLDFTFFGRILEFFIGIGLSLFVIKSKLIFKFRYFTYLGILSIITNIFVLSLLKVNNGFGTDCLIGKVINTLILPVFGIAPLLYGLIKEKTFVSSILNSTIFNLLGKSSYVFYLIHIGVFSLLFKMFMSNNFLLFIVLNLTSIVLYLYVEKPLNNFFRSKIID